MLQRETLGVGDAGDERELEQPAAGGDRDVARDILGGICDIGIANAYYVGHMKNAAPGSDGRKWGDGIKAIRPTFAGTGGTHVLVLANVGDLGPEGLHFIPAAKSPNGKPLLMVGNEVSGTTAVYQLQLQY